MGLLLLVSTLVCEAESAPELRAFQLSGQTAQGAQGSSGPLTPSAGVLLMSVLGFKLRS